MMHKIEDKAGIMHKYIMHRFEQLEKEAQEWKEREEKKKQLIEKTATSLYPTAGILYRAIREAGVSFDGENGPAIITMDRQKWRELETFLKELENE